MATASISQAVPSRGSKMTLGFGLIAVPVRYKPLAETVKTIAGKMMCEEHHATVNQQYVCSRGEKREHVVEKTVKGYPHPDSPDRLIIIDQSVLDEFTESRTGQAIIERVVDISSVDPAYFDRTFLVWPETGSEAAFDLLTSVLRESGSAAVVSSVLTKQTRMIVFRWSEQFGCLLGHVCQFNSMLRFSEIEKIKAGAALRKEPSKQEKELAHTLLESIRGEFDATEVEDIYTPLVQDAIRKAAGGKKFVPEKELDHPDDILSVLKASIDAAPKKRKKVAA